MKGVLAAVLALAATAGFAQGTVETIDPQFDPNGFVETIVPQWNLVPDTETPGPLPEPRTRVAPGDGAIVRWLDKVSGATRNVEMKAGESRTLGRIEVTLGDCRFPVSNVTGEAYAWLDIRSVGREELDFSGWMVASSPALSALDHPRYDVWVIRCTRA